MCRLFLKCYDVFAGCDDGCDVSDGCDGFGNAIGCNSRLHRGGSSIARECQMGHFLDGSRIGGAGTGFPSASWAFVVLERVGGFLSTSLFPLGSGLH